MCFDNAITHHDWKDGIEIEENERVVLANASFVTSPLSFRKHGCEISRAIDRD